MNTRSFVQLARDAYRELLKYNPSLMAAGLAYFTLFSLIPFLMIVTALFGRIIGETKARAELLRFVDMVASSEAAASIDALIVNIRRARFGAVTAVSVAVL